jgi:enolase
MAADSISRIHAVEILDSRGIPTVSVTLQLENGIVATGTVPGGTSAGSHEATELRDGDLHRYRGKGVLSAVTSVNTRLTQDLKGLFRSPRRGLPRCCRGCRSSSICGSTSPSRKKTTTSQRRF